jgi:hypothetical protein
MRQNRRVLVTAAPVLILILFGPCLGDSVAQAAQADRTVSAVNGNQNDDGLILPDAPSTLFPTASWFPSAELFKNNLKPDSDSVAEKLLHDHRSPSSNPLSTADKFQRFLRHSFSPSAFGGTLLDAGQAQIHNDWPGYGPGLKGFERRYGALLADRSVNSFFGTFLFPSLFHQDPRRSRLGPGFTVWRRIGNAVGRVGVTRDDYGKPTFNSSLAFSTILSQSLTNLYYPRQQRGFSPTVARVEGSMLGNIQGNLTREFLPDIEHFLWKHAPSWLKRFEQRLPFSEAWQPQGFSESSQTARR